MALHLSVRAAAPIPLDIAFQVAAHELLALVGPSGSGKTTLLRTIAGLWTPHAGRVTVDGQVWLDRDGGIDLPPHRRRVGIVVQNYALFPHMTALRNVMTAMDRPDPSEAARLLDLVNLHDLAHRKPAQLSGGEQQRVALARALARRPHVLLLDEPFSAVDRPTRQRLYAEIIALRTHLAMPVILVTHDMAEARLLADRTVMIDKGRLVAQGPTDRVLPPPDGPAPTPSSPLPATIHSHLPNGLTRLAGPSGPLLVPAVPLPEGTRVTLHVAPHEVILSSDPPGPLSAPAILAATVRDLVPDGPGVIVHLMAGPIPLLCRMPPAALTLKAGDSVYAILTNPVVSLAAEG